MEQWTEPTYNIIDTENRLTVLCKKINEAQNNRDIISIDVETTGPTDAAGLDRYHGWLLGISIAFNKNEGFYIPLMHTKKGVIRNHQLPLRLVREKLNECISERGTYLLHNAKFDYGFLFKSGIMINPNFWDTMLAIKIINGGLQKTAKLKEVIEHYVNIPYSKRITSFEEASGGNAAEEDPVEFCVYAIDDVIYPQYIYEELKPTIDKDFYKLFYEIEMPLIPVLTQMEMKGIRINKEYYDEIKVPLLKAKSKILSYYQNTYGINVASTDQVGKMLLENFKGLKLKRNKGTNNISTDEETLETIIKEHSSKERVHKEAKHILKFRSLNKAINTYVEKFPKVSEQQWVDGKCFYILHTNFNQIVATGRLSTSPNTQNLTRDDKGGGIISIRKGFCARPGYWLVEADWASMELRLIAVYSQEPKMLELYLKDPLHADLHELTGQGMFEKEKLTSYERFLAKKTNFLISYGGTEYRLAKELNIEKELAKEYIDRYNMAYPRVAEWKEEVKEEIKRNRYTETLYKRRRYLHESTYYGMNEWWKYEGGERELINHIIQGTCADCLKLVKNKVTKAFADKNMDATYLINSTHDAVFVETTEPEAAKEIVEREMTMTIKGLLFPVDLEVKKTFAKVA